MRRIKLLSILVLVALSLGLTACSSGGDSSSSESPQLTWDQGNWDQKNWQ